MIPLNKEDGTLSKTMIWNYVVIMGTSIFGVAVAMLPDIEKVIPPEGYVLIALLVKGVDLGLRTITTQPLQKKPYP
jgi:hypothetical protein